MWITKVVISGKMPERCEDCDFHCVGADHWCDIKRKNIDTAIEENRKPKWCPLVKEA